MSQFQKFLVLIFFGMILSAFFVYEVYGQEPLVESSIAYDYKVGSNTKLFNDIGAHDAGINPCLDLEENTLRWCSIHSAKEALKEIPLDNIDRDFIEAAFKTKFPCTTISIYIGEVCKHENFLKIIRHFTNRNE